MNHFKHTLKVMGAVVVLLIGAYLWLKHKIYNVIVPPQITLPRNDKELIRYDENRHIITVTTSKGTMREYSRNPTVEIRKDGTVKIDNKPFGLELHPFLGAGYSDTARAYAGVQWAYFRQFDIGTSFGFTADNRRAAFQPMLSIGYNFWSNTSLHVGLNPLTVVGYNKPEPALFLSVRL